MKISFSVFAGLCLCVLLALPVSAQESIWIEDSGTCNISSVSVPVWSYNDNTALSSFTLTVQYDHLVLNFVDCQAGLPLSDWQTVSCTESPVGTLNIIASAGTGTSVPLYTETVLVDLNFDYPAGVTVTGSPLVLAATGGDLSGFSTTDGSFSWHDGCGIALSSETGCIDPVTVMVSLTNSSPVNTLYAEIDYDNTMLEFTGSTRTGLTNDWTLITAYEVVGSEGTIIITGSTDYGGSEIISGSSGDLIELAFDVTCASCTEDQTSSLVVQDTGNDLIGYTSTDGVFTYHCGTPAPPAVIVGDSSHHHMISVPINIDNAPNAVDAFVFNLTYDDSVLEYINCHRGDLTTGFEEVDGNVIVPGVVTMGGYDPDPIAAGSTGTLAYANFNVICSSCSGGDTSIIEIGNLLDDLEHWETQSGVFTYLDAPPIPSTSVFGILMMMLSVSIWIGLNRNR